MLKKKVLVTLSDESLEALRVFDDDVKALLDMTHDLAETSHRIREMIETEALDEVAVEQEEEQEIGVIVERSNGAPKVAFEGIEITPGETTYRTTPFTRAPRQVQVDWLKEVMADGVWHAGYEIARTYATDERHLRYMRSAVTGRLREMHEDGLVERRDSHVKGSMFEYRLKER